MEFENVTLDDMEHFKAVRQEGMRPHVEREGLKWQQDYEDMLHDSMFNHGYKFKTLHKVIDEDGSVAGYIGISPTINIGIWLDSDHRGRGIGTKAMEKVFEEYPHMRFELDVFKHSPAKRLYEKLGFKYLSENQLFYYMERHRN